MVPVYHFSRFVAILICLLIVKPSPFRRGMGSGFKVLHVNKTKNLKEGDFFPCGSPNLLLKLPNYLPSEDEWDLGSKANEKK